MRTPIALLLGALTLATQASPTPARLVLVLDASGSMWGKVGPETKVAAARRAVRTLADALPDGSQVGLVAYGHRREADCADVETLLPLGPLDRAGLAARVEALPAKGKTPLTASLKQAIALARGTPGRSTVVLVSDGLETCGGDPCAVAREARAAGVDIVLHVVGFDVAGQDASQLECAAQAGGGQYFDARDAAALASALRQAAAAGPALSSRLLVKAEVQGQLADASVTVRPAGKAEVVASGRTYATAETNPRALPVPPGSYDVEVLPVRLEGATAARFPAVKVAEGETVERVASFGQAELSVGVTRNDKLSDATVELLDVASGKPVATGRTYRDPDHNPELFRVPPGTYHVRIKSVEIEGRPSHELRDVKLGGARVELRHAFDSGTLRIGVRRGAELVDATIAVLEATGGKEVARGRSYKAASSNPKGFDLLPGRYRVVVTPVGGKGAPRQVELEARAGATTEHTFDLASS